MKNWKLMCVAYIHAAKLVLSFCTLSIAVTLYSGCSGDWCTGIDTEPFVGINFSQPTSHTHAYGVKERVESIPMSSYGVQMPLSIRVNKTTLCFVAPDRIDTLTLTYFKEAIAESLECGVRLYVSDIRVVKPTTFTRVTVNGDQIYIHND